jgi:hypothetical protein
MTTVADRIVEILSAANVSRVYGLEGPQEVAWAISGFLGA